MKISVKYKEFACDNMKSHHLSQWRYTVVKLFVLHLRWAVVANIEVFVFRVGTVCHCTAEFVGSVPNNLTTTGKIQNRQAQGMNVLSRSLVYAV